MIFLTTVLIFISIIAIIWLAVKFFINTFIEIELKKQKNKQAKLEIEISRYKTAELESERNVKKSLALKRRARSFRNHSKLIISIAISILLISGSYLILKFLYEYYNIPKYLP